MPETNVAEPPPSVTPIENPVLPSDIDVSKQIFRDAMAAEKGEPAPEQPETPSPAPPEPKKDSGDVSTTTDQGRQQPDTQKKADASSEKPTETPAAKSKLPEELITGKKPESPKVDDAIAELDAMVLPKNAKPEQVASFAKLKEQAKKVIEEKVGRIRELETKTSESTSRNEIEAAQERVKAAETRAKELESTIERIAFTESPKFKQFLTDEAATLASAKAYFEGTEINPEIVEYAARVGGAQRVKILREAGMDAELIASVQPYLAEFDKIQRYKAGALENWKTESVQMAERQKAQQEAQLAQRKAEEDKVWENVASKLKGEVAAFQKFDAHDDWNKRGDELLSEWKRIYNGENVDLPTVAEMIGYGVAYKAEHEIRLAITEELNQKIEENTRLKAAKPNGGSIQGAGTPTNDENLTPEEAAKRRFNAEKEKAAQGV